MGSRASTHRHPADLRPQVPEVQCGCGAHRQLLQNILILQGLALCREAGHSSGATQAFAHRHRGAQGWSSNSCTHWGPGGGTDGQGTTADLRGEQGVTAHSLGGPKDPTAPATESKASATCGSRTQPGRALAGAGCCPSENQARAFLPVATWGRCNRQAQKVLGSTMGISAGPGGRGCQEGSHPEAPAQRGCRRQCGWALDLRLLVKRFLISAMVAWGST